MCKWYHANYNCRFTDWAVYPKLVCAFLRPIHKHNTTTKCLLPWSRVCTSRQANIIERKDIKGKKTNLIIVGCMHFMSFTVCVHAFKTYVYFCCRVSAFRHFLEPVIIFTKQNHGMVFMFVCADVSITHRNNPYIYFVYLVPVHVFLRNILQRLYARHEFRYGIRVLVCKSSCLVKKIARKHKCYLMLYKNKRLLSFTNCVQF